MENLHPEITVDIISRLPFESVLDCRRVSKTWRDLISQPSFARLHLLHCSHSSSLLQQQQLNDDDDDDQDNKTHYSASAADSSSKVCFITLIRRQNDDDDCRGQLFYGEYDGDQNMNMNMNEKEKEKLVVTINDEIYFLNPYLFMEESCKKFTKIRINHPLFCMTSRLVDSCNGLICVTAWNRGMDDPVYICNPITREYIELPKFSKKQSWDGVVVSGFGYHPRTNEYKVVRIYYDFDNKPEVGWVQVYTLGSGSGWRDKGETKYQFDSLRKANVLANGALHWWDFEEKRYVSFDLVDEEFRLLPSPPCDGGQYKIRALGGLLYFFHQKEGESVVKVWSLNKMKKSSGNYNMKKEHDYYESWNWTLEFSIQQKTDFMDSYKPFALTKSGQVLLWDFNSAFWRYDLKTATFERLEDYAQGAKGIINIIPHINSFISLKALGEDAKIIGPAEEVILRGIGFS